jgi:serine/threonine-protein kinase
VHVGPFVISRRCIVPAVRGKRLAAAVRALRAARCPVGRATRAPSRRFTAGRVISQRPGAGARLRAGSKVALVVSRGR